MKGENDALQAAEEAVTGARQSIFGAQPIAQLALARVLLRTKGLAARDAIETALQETSRLARQMEMKMLEPFVCVERAELAGLAGDEGARERELREAHRQFTEIVAPIRAPEVAKELGLATEVSPFPRFGRPPFAVWRILLRRQVVNQELSPSFDAATLRAASRRPLKINPADCSRRSIFPTFRDSAAIFRLRPVRPYPPTGESSLLQKAPRSEPGNMP